MIRLRVQHAVALNGKLHDVGDVIEIEDKELADSMLRSGTAVPADPPAAGAPAWCKKAPRENWVTSWRVYR